MIAGSGCSVFIPTVRGEVYFHVTESHGQFWIKGQPQYSMTWQFSIDQRKVPTSILGMAPTCACLFIYCSLCPDIRTPLLAV